MKEPFKKYHFCDEMYFTRSYWKIKRESRLLGTTVGLDIFNQIEINQNLANFGKKTGLKRRVSHVVFFR